MSNLALTFADLRKRQAPDGGIDQIIEVLSQSDPVLQDVTWMQGNLPTGNVTTQRTTLPQGYLRQVNRGVPAGKSSTRQIVDTCCLLEARSEVDVELLALQPNPEAFRASEDAAFVEGMGQQVANYIFYGDSSSNADEFNGLSVRYNAYGGNRHEYAGQVVSAGGSKDKAQTSAFLVCWGDKAVRGIYPKYGFAGLKRQDLGEGDCFDENNNKFRGVTTLFNWKPGLSVRDPEMVAAVRNIDVATLLADNDGSGASKNLVFHMITAQNKIRTLNGVKPVWYVNRDVYTQIEKFYSSKNSAYITRQELANGMPQLYVNGILVKKEDAILNTEPVIASK